MAEQFDLQGSGLSSRVSSHCLCWALTRRDGLVIGLTDHDRSIVYGGTHYAPGAALEGSRFETSIGLSPGSVSAAGALSSDAMTAADLEAGLWNRARVDVRRIDWMTGIEVDHVWSGYFSEITRGVHGFEASLVSLKADLERPLGRVFSSACDAVLGDARCGVDLTDPAFAGAVCDQRFETCRSRFSNGDNFRGFPHMPGTDFVLSGPNANGRYGGQQ